jgi:putative oligomerization/nucleic acid binding protein/phospholipase D-like protein
VDTLASTERWTPALRLPPPVAVRGAARVAGSAAPGQDGGQSWMDRRPVMNNVMDISAPVAAHHSVYLAYDYPVLGAFWTAMWVFLWVLWVFLLFRIVIDLFRDDSVSGWAKAGWLFFVLVLPFLGVFVYLCVRGNGMGVREAHHVKAQREEFDDYIRKTAATHGGAAAGAAGPQGGSSVDELARLADMKSSGHLSEEEFQRAKEKLLH